MHSLPQQGEIDEDIYRERFERCFDEHYLKIFAFALRRVPGRESAEDVVADTFAVAWRRRDLIPDPALPWLYAIAANVVANQSRSSGRRRDLDLRLAREASVSRPERDPADSIAGRDELAAAFAGLEESDRELLRLVAWEGLSTAEAARVIGCSPGAARVRLHRARRKLAKELKRADRRAGAVSRAASRPAEEGS
jgi:RNA polymerase sigma-70 factor (ECF subfamily)